MDNVTPYRSLLLDVDACTSCNLCAVECPTWCIEVSSHTQPRENGRGSIKILDDLTVDYGLCMYCGICVDVCPFDALAWSAEPIMQRDNQLVLSLARPVTDDATSGIETDRG